MTALRYLTSNIGFLIFLTALLIRLGLVISFPNLIPEAQMQDKFHRYDPIAMSLLEGKGFAINGEPTAISGPVYPFFLSVIYILFGYSKTGARIFLSFIDAAHPLLFYLIAKRYFGGLVPILTALVLIFHPLFIYEIFSMASETLFFFLHALFIFCFSWALQKKDMRGLLIGGMLLGMATLCRAVSSLLPVFTLPIFFIVYRAKLKQGLFHLAIFLFGFALVVTPWIARNYMAFQRFVPVQELGGIHFYWATPRQHADEEWKKDHERTLEMNRVQRDRFYYEKALEQIKENPLAYIQLMGQRLLSMWYKTYSGKYENFTLLANGVLLLFAVPGIIMTWKKWQNMLQLLTVIIYYIVLHMAIITLVRYILPIIPILTIFAMVTINKLAQSLYVRRNPGSVPQLP